MIIDKLQHLISALADADIAAALDPRDVNAPGAWITARKIKEMLFCGDIQITADVYLISRDVGTLQALEVLDQLLQQALEALASWDIEIDATALDEAVALPDGSGPLPAYKITVTL